MFRVSVIIFIIHLFVFGQSIFPSWFVNPPLPQENSIYAVGYVGSYSSPKNGLQAAKEHALTQLAQYFVIYLKYDLIKLGDGRMLIDDPKFEKGYNLDIIERLKKNSVVIDSFYNQSSCFVLLGYPKTANFSLGKTILTDWGSKPEWVEDIHSDENFIYGVGIVGRYSKWTKAWRDADDLARFDIIKTLVLSVDYQRTERQDQFSATTAIIGRQESNFELKNSIIIARWYDKNTNTFYSLARAPKP